MMDAISLLEQASRIVRDAGKLLFCREMAEQVWEKGRTDFVTAVDTEVQTQIWERLLELDDSIQFMGEEQENASLDLRRPTWILDPVDGTTNLIHAFRHSAISLALVREGTVLLGMIYDPYADELFTALSGGGAFCNGKPIRVSSTHSLADSLCSVGTNPGHREEAELAFCRMRAIYDRCHDVRLIGAASIELCYVACGRLDCYLEHSLKPWDYAAGKLLVEEAGGQVTAFRGEKVSLSLPGCDILASNGAIHRELMPLL